MVLSLMFFVYTFTVKVSPCTYTPSIATGQALDASILLALVLSALNKALTSCSPNGCCFAKTTSSADGCKYVTTDTGASKLTDGTAYSIALEKSTSTW